MHKYTQISAQRTREWMYDITAQNEHSARAIAAAHCNWNVDNVDTQTGSLPVGQSAHWTQSRDRATTTATSIMCGLSSFRIRWLTNTEQPSRMACTTQTQHRQTRQSETRRHGNSSDVLQQCRCGHFPDTDATWSADKHTHAAMPFNVSSNVHGNVCVHNHSTLFIRNPKQSLDVPDGARLCQPKNSN